MRECHLPTCRKQRTPYKGSMYCGDHTCRDSFCRRPKTRIGAVFCDTCHCRYRGCEKDRATYFSEDYCLDHFCDTCREGYREGRREDGKRCCRVCLGKCEYAYKNCRADKVAGGRFCTDHTCSLPDCLAQKMDEHVYCLDKHRCKVYQCPNLRTTCEPDAKKCDEHMSRCAVCAEPRPAGFTGEYWCDRHGCTECHGTVKHSYRLNRETIRSEKCRLHCEKEDTAFPPDTPAFREFMGRLRRVVRQKNEAITTEDADKHNLSCSDYCSRGYCRCDRMPRMDVKILSPKTVEAGVYLKETVYLLSREARVYSDGYSTRDDYKAWTIPKILVDGFDERDTTEAALQKSIDFEYLS
ncbi:hypothetical protein EBZ80_02445 [bacterium]|nr:hypothetical protein [bacterium]